MFFDLNNDLVSPHGIKRTNEPEESELLYQQAQELEKADKMSEAYLVYQSASNKGHIKATTCVGFLVLLGKGTSPNKSEAYQYFLHSAKHGHVRAMMCLAKMSAQGDGVTQNLHQALLWYEKAGELGDQKGITKAQEIRKLLKLTDLDGK